MGPSSFVRPSTCTNTDPRQRRCAPPFRSVYAQRRSSVATHTVLPAEAGVRRDCFAAGNWKHWFCGSRRLAPESAFPVVVCAALSIELGIKSLLLRSGSPPKTHNLTKLFVRLAPTVQDCIVASCGRQRDAFDKSLDEIANVFEEWRYI